ncbi:wd g-beta repeat-containing protein [Cystoisospora suis]|uniref:Wd g-beta repeat-containing protein n=1 Tax=Cystoisospora suis TaxID=483139 RepID=A0A2C6L7Y3_9APIC|nr:wd g-beta repeat-containing protein [Cystoisospora suis]
MSDPPASPAADGPQLPSESRGASLLLERPSSQSRTRSAISATKNQAARNTRRRARREHKEAAVSSAWEALVNTFAECYYTLRQDEEGLHPLSPPLLDLPAKKPGASHHVALPPRRQGLPTYHAITGTAQLPALPAGRNSSSATADDRRIDRRFALLDAPKQPQSHLLFGSSGGLHLELLALEHEGECHPAKAQRQRAAEQPVNAVEDLEAPCQLLRVQRRRQGVLSEAEILDSLTNQKVAEIQYEFAARNGEVDVAEFIHILLRQLRNGQDSDPDRPPDAVSEPPSAVGGGASAAAREVDHHLAIVPTAEGYVSSTRLSVPAYNAAGTKESADASLLGARLLSGSGARRHPVAPRERDKGRAVSLVGDAGNQDLMGSWVRARGSVAALQDYHETIEQELSAGGRLMELFDLIDVDDAQKISWEAFTTFIVDRGRNEDALRRLHMQRLEKTDLCDSRLHLSPIERLAPACDPLIGLDIIFYYEEHSKTVELISPQLLPVPDQPPLQHQFNITAVAYCPLVHHLVVAAADLSLTFYDMRGAVNRQSNVMGPKASRGRKRNLEPLSASANSRKTSPLGRSTTVGRPPGDDPWRVTRTFKTRTSQIVFFPSVSRPWLYSADHEGSIYAWDLELICSPGAGSASGGALDDAGDSHRVRGAVGEAIDLGGLVTPARLGTGAMSLQLPTLSGSYGSSNYALSSTRQLPASSHSAGSAGRSQQFSVRSSDKANSAFGSVPQSGGTPAGKRQSAAGKNPGRRVSSQTKIPSRSGFFTSDPDGLSLFDSFTASGRPSVVLGSRHPQNSIERQAAEEGGDASSSQGPLAKAQPPSSRGKGLRVTSATLSSGDAACGGSRPSSSALSGSRGGGGLDATLSATDLSSFSEGSNTLKGSSGRLRPQRSPSLLSSVPSSAGAGPHREKDSRQNTTSHYRSVDNRLPESSSSPRSASLARGERTNIGVPGWGCGAPSVKSRVRAIQHAQGSAGEGAQSGVSTTRLTLGGAQPRNGCHSPSGGGSEGGYVPQEPQAHLMRWRQFRAHADIVTAFEELEAMDLLATCGMDAKIYLWEPTTGELKRTLDGHIRGVKALCFDAPNRVLLSGGFDYKLVAWNPYVGKKLHTIRGHSAPVISICMLGANSRQFVSFDSEGIIKTWDLSTSACLQTLVTEELPVVRAVVALPEHNALLCAGKKVVALTHGLVQDSLELANENGNAGTRGGAKGQGAGLSRFSSLGQQTGPLAVSPPPAGKHRTPLGGVSIGGETEPLLVKAVAHLVVRVLVTAGGRHLRVWDLCTGALVSSIEHVCKGAEHAISDICLDEKGRKVFVADQSGCICAYSVCTGQLMQRFSSHGAEVSQILYAEGGDRNLISVSWDRSIVVHDDGPCNSSAATRKCSLGPTLAGGKGTTNPRNRLQSLGLEWPHSPGASSPATSGRRQGGDRSEGDRGRPQNHSLVCTGNVTTGAEGSERSTASARRSPSKRRGGETISGNRYKCSLSPDVPQAALGNSPQKGGDNKIWRMVKNAHLGDLTCCAFSRRSGLLATGGADCAIFVWDYERLRRVTSLFGHKYDLSALSFIDPLPLLCSADAGGTICIWVLPPHPHAIRVLEALPSPVLGPQAASTLLAGMTGVSVPNGNTSSLLGANTPGNSTCLASHSGEPLCDTAATTRSTSAAKLPGAAQLIQREGAWPTPDSEENDAAGQRNGSGRGSAAGPVQSSLPLSGGAEASSAENSLSSCEERNFSSLGAASGQPETEKVQLNPSCPTGTFSAGGRSGAGGGKSNMRSAAAVAGLSPSSSSGGERAAKLFGIATTAKSFSPGVAAATAGGLSLNLLLVRLVDMERVSETTPLTALASFCRIQETAGRPSPNNTPNNSGRSIRFAEGPSAISTYEVKRAWTGSATPSPICSPRERTATVSSSPPDSKQGATGKSERQEEIPPTPHSTTFLTTTDGSEPPAEEGGSRLSRGTLGSPQQGGSVSPSVHQPMRGRLIQRATEHGGGEGENVHSASRGEILIFAGDEKGRVRVWDVSVLLSLLRETGPVKPKADWQPHRVYREDLRESTASLFRRVVQQQQNFAKHMNGEAVASPSASVTFMPQQGLLGGSGGSSGGGGAGGWGGRQRSARPAVRHSLIREAVMDNGVFDKAADTFWATTDETAGLSRESLGRHVRNRGGTITAPGPTEDSTWEASAGTFQASPPLLTSGGRTPGVTASSRADDPNSSLPGMAQSPHRRDSQRGASSFLDTNDTSRTSDSVLNGTSPPRQGKENGTSPACQRKESMTALTVVNSSSVGSGNERGHSSLSSTASSASSCSLPLPPPGVVTPLPHFQQPMGQGLYGDSNTIVSDPILAYEDIPALFPKAPVKLVGVWKAHRSSVQSLQFLALSKPKSSMSVSAARKEENSSKRNSLGHESLSKGGDSDETGKATCDQDQRGSPVSASSVDSRSRKGSVGKEDRGTSLSFRNLLVSGGAEGAVRVWDVSGFSSCKPEVLRKSLPTLFLDFTQQEKNALRGPCSDISALGGSGARTASGGGNAYAGDERHSAQTLALALSSSSPVLNKENCLLVPRPSVPSASTAITSYGGKVLQSSEHPARGSETDGESSSLSFSFHPTPQQYSVILLGDLQINTTGGHNPMTRGGIQKLNFPLLNELTDSSPYSSSILWNVDLGDYDYYTPGGGLGGDSGATDYGGGAQALPTAAANAKRLVQTHMRVKQLEHEQQLADEQQQGHLVGSSLKDFHIPRLLAPDALEEGQWLDGQMGKDLVTKVGSNTEKEEADESCAIGGAGGRRKGRDLILGGNTWVKGGDKGGGVWAAVYAKRQSIVERTASF